MTKQKSSKRTGAVDRHVAAQIRLKREAVGLSQEALGLAIGVSFQQVQKYERAENRVSVARLVAIANALREPIVEFLP